MQTIITEKKYEQILRDNGIVTPFMLHHLCYQSHWEEKEKGSERGFEDIVAANIPHLET